MMRAAAGPIPDRSSEIEVRDLIRMIRAGWLLVLGSAIVFAGLAFLAGFLMTNQYRAVSTLLPANSQGGGGLTSLAKSLGGLAMLGGLDIGKEGSEVEALAVLRSEQLVRLFVEEYDLAPVLFADDWDMDASDWRPGTNPIPTMAKAAKKFKTDVLKISEDKRTGLISISMTWEDRDKVSVWANSFVEKLNEVMRKRALKRASANLKFLQNELEKTDVVEVRRSIYKNIEGQIETIMLANVTNEFAYMVVDPAVTPDREDIVSPRKLVMAFSGGIVGLFVGLLLTLSGRPGLRRNGAANPSGDTDRP